MCSFLGKLMLSLVGSLGNRWTCGLERGMGWRCYGSSHLGHTLLETIKVHEAGQEMVLNKKSPRKASKEYLNDRSRIHFSQRKPGGVREMEREPEDSGAKEESLRKDRWMDGVKC